MPAASDDTMVWPAPFGVPALLVGAIFVLATLLPYGVFRRLVVGVGTALVLGGAAFVLAFIAALPPVDFDYDLGPQIGKALAIGGAAGLVVFLLGFYAGFRLSR